MTITVKRNNKKLEVFWLFPAQLYGKQNNNMEAERKGHEKIVRRGYGDGDAL